MIFSCNDETIPEDYILNIKEISYDSCYIPKSAVSDTNEILHIKFLEDGYYLIEHINGIFNCCPGGININAAFINGKLIYQECENTPLCNCICPMNVYSKIGPIKHSKYSFEINHCGEKLAELNINFSDSLDLSYVINKP